MASEYVPGRTVTVATPLFCAYDTAEPMIENCAEPSCATVTTESGELDVVDEVELEVGDELCAATEATRHKRLKKRITNGGSLNWDLQEVEKNEREICNLVIQAFICYLYTQ